MPTTLKPVVSQWYRHLDKGQQFYVTALDEEEEMDFDDWRELAIEAIEPPEDWTGPVDDVERDDLGYTETDMTAEDWEEPLQEKGQQAEGEREEEEEERREE